MSSSLRLCLTLNVQDPELLWHRAAMTILSTTESTAGDIESLIGSADDPDLEACLMQLGASIEFAGCQSADQELIGVDLRTASDREFEVAAAA